eukprot:1155839-Pelagomonas_calceolata.AAC.2
MDSNGTHFVRSRKRGTDAKLRGEPGSPAKGAQGKAQSGYQTHGAYGADIFTLCTRPSVSSFGEALASPEVEQP